MGELMAILTVAVMAGMVFIEVPATFYVTIGVLFAAWVIHTIDRHLRDRRKTDA